jgi:hypothetical protein
MRLTVDEALDRGLIGKVEVYVDGKKVRRCIEADEEEGYVVCYLEDEHGRLILDANKNPVTARVCGKVEIRILDDATPA